MTLLSFRKSSLLMVLATGAALPLFTGCGAITGNLAVPGPIPVQGAALQGRIFGGQQPVVGSTIQLYAVGTSGYGTAATPLITGTAVQSNSSGGFSITGTYTCPNANTQVYITASGGNAGAGNNNALAMMAGLGSCGTLIANASTTFIYINEITTVGAVWALSPFMQGAVVGAPASNQSGLALAFTDIAQIANNATGATPGKALPTGAIAPTTEINTLADMIASCVNSSGASSMPCAMLFSNTTVNGTAPTNTIAAAVNIAQHPGQNVQALLGLVTAAAPFQPTLTSATDYTLGVTYPVGSTPVALAVDSGNNIWVANQGSSNVSVVAHSGTTSTYTGGGVAAPTGVAIDMGGNVWLSNSNNTLTALTGTGTALAGSPFTGGGLNVPSSVAIDGLNQVWVANGGGRTVSLFSTSGAAVSPSSGIPASSVDGTGLVGVAISPQ